RVALSEEHLSKLTHSLLTWLVVVSPQYDLATFKYPDVRILDCSSTTGPTRAYVLVFENLLASVRGLLAFEHDDRKILVLAKHWQIVEWPGLVEGLPRPLLATLVTVT